MSEVARVNVWMGRQKKNRFLLLLCLGKGVKLYKYECIRRKRNEREKKDMKRRTNVAGLSKSLYTEWD